ncbi:MAG: hypothetical protein LBK57_02745 [Clostridiales Family XIII bacterium]|jgi:hypothetical protein|nr:hypothetical protein [Clostridiales Family XIII bacterium]
MTTFSEKFPESERAYYEANSKLLRDWKSCISDEMAAKGYSSDVFVTDGFYPYYYSQKTKVLFIAAECTGLSGRDYIEIIYGAYKENRIGDPSQHINQYKFHERMFRITYGINNNFPEWDQIPRPSELTTDFGAGEGVSFAFMELSKFSNDTGRYQKNFKAINDFVGMSQNEERNFWNDQIKILNPDLIIAMNLNSYLNCLGNITVIYDKNCPREYTLDVGHKKITLLDTYHFSYLKGAKTHFYDPIVSILKRNGVQQKGT